MYSSGSDTKSVSSRGGFREHGHGSEDIDFMVKTLNKHLNLNLTLVSFDELSSKKPNKLLELLNNIIGYLSPESKLDFNKEPPEQAVMKIYQFLVVILGFKNLKQDQNEVMNGLAAGDRRVIYPIIYMICSKIDDLIKRVYLAKYLVEVKVPDEFLLDSEVNSVFQQYKQLIQQFKTTHQQTTQLKETTPDPEEIKGRIFKMEREKEQLKIKIDEQTKKMHELSNDADAFIELTSKLNVEQDERISLEKSKQDQLAKLVEQKTRLQEIQQILEETEKEIGSGDIDTHLHRLEDQVRALRETNQLKLPQEVSEKQQKIEILKKISVMSSMSDALNTVENDIRRLKEEITTLQDQLSQKTEGEQTTNKEGDNKLTSIAKIMQKKNQEYAKRLAQLQKDLKKGQQKRQKLEEELKQFEGQKIPTPEELEKLQKEIMTKATVAKRMKAELAEIKKEKTTLKRTVDILKLKDDKVEELLSRIEQQKGITGFRSVQQNIESVSEEKSKIDKEKGDTLEEITKIVQELTEKINSQKERMKQPVKQLIKLREEHHEVMNEHGEKRAIYENIKLSQETEVSKLKGDIKELQEEIDRQQSLYFLLKSQVTLNNVMKERVDKEKDFLDTKNEKKLGKEYPSYTAMLKARIEKLEVVSKDLREKQKYIKETHEPNLKQIEMFKNLKKLLELKLRANRESTFKPSLGGTEFISGGVDRLVL
ncbi:hypothetical protein ABK040_006100 [Willaertia magna]